MDQYLVEPNYWEYIQRELEMMSTGIVDVNYLSVQQEARHVMYCLITYIQAHMFNYVKGIIKKLKEVWENPKKSFVVRATAY